jgi:hypothetical protein
MGAMAAISAAMLARLSVTGDDTKVAGATVLALTLSCLMPVLVMLLGLVQLPLAPALMALCLATVAIGRLRPAALSAASA